MEHKDSARDVTRRAFFKKAIAGIAGFIAVSLGIPLLGYSVLPALRRKAEQWSEAGPLSELEAGSPKELEIIVPSSGGWMKNSTVRSVWAFKNQNGEVTAYSPSCTHLGCGYRWTEEEKKFLCPCHNSIFDLEGNVLAGPAPRPLDILPVKLEGDRLFVQYKEFKAGLPNKEEL